MHAFQVGQGLHLAGGLDVQRLAAAHARGAGGGAQGAQPGHAQFGGDRGFGEDLESQRLQGIAGEDRGGFVEGDVHGGPAATQRVIVHGRQVVVHQRIGVDQFDRGGGRVQPAFLGAEDAAGGVHQQRADALAAAQCGMAHGGVQALRGQRGRRQGLAERHFDTLCPADERRFSFHRASARRVRRFRAVPDR